MLSSKSHLSKLLMCLFYNKGRSDFRDRVRQQAKSGIFILPLMSSCCVILNNCVSLSELQLILLPNGSENPFLLKDGTRPGDNTIIVCSEAGGPAGSSCVGEFQGGTLTGWTRRTSILGGNGTQGWRVSSCSGLPGFWALTPTWHRTREQREV